MAVAPSHLIKHLTTYQRCLLQLLNVCVCVEYELCSLSARERVAAAAAAAETYHGTVLCVEYGVGVLIFSRRKFVFAAMMEETRKAGHFVVVVAAVFGARGQAAWGVSHVGRYAR